MDHVTIMAPDVVNLNSSAINSTILNGLDDHVAHILHQLGVKSDGDILSDLCDLEITDLSDIREYLFKASVDIVKNRIIEQGIPIGQIRVVLRRRNKAKTLSEDILKLVYYIIKHVEIFPKDVLSMNGQYVDLNVSNCTEHDENGQNSENGQYKKLVDCISDLTNKYDALDRSHKDLRKDYTELERSHAIEIQQIRDAIQNKKPSKTLDPKHRDQTASSTASQHSSADDPITPGQPQQTKTQTNGSTHGSNSGRRPGVGDTGTKSSDHGSVGGPSSVSESFSGHSTPDVSELLQNAYDTQPINNEQSRQKPVFRDPSKRLIDSSTSPGLVKIDNHDININTDSGDMQSESDDDGYQEVIYRRRRTRSNNNNLITGIKRETGVKVYVQNLHRKPGQHLREISDNVRKYCSSKGVRSMNAFAIRNKVTDDMVGCQLTVPMRYYDTVIADRFWPAEVVCKKWESKTPLLADQPGEPPASTGLISGHNRSKSRDKQRGAARSRSLSTNRSKSRGRSWTRGPRS